MRVCLAWNALKAWRCEGKDLRMGSLELRFVGCGDAFGSGGRFNTCFHLTGEQTNLLIDCGASSLVAMKQQGVNRNAIEAIIVTHFHADHFGGIPFFILDAQFFSKRREPLTIVGPPGLPEWYERVMETGFPGSSIAHQKFGIELRELSAASETVIGSTRISAFQALHGPPDAPCLAVRLQVDGKVVAYTGDGEWTAQLVEIARDADLLVAEAYFRDRKIATHLCLCDIEEHLSELGMKRLILTHMSDDMLGHLDDLEFDIAHDGMVVRIG